MQEYVQVQDAPSPKVVYVLVVPNFATRKQERIKRHNF